TLDNDPVNDWVGTTSPTFHVVGSDVGSGIASVKVERQDAPMGGTACGTFGPYSTIAANISGANQYVDTTYRATGLVQARCYQFRWTASDQAGNTTTSVSGPLRVDAVAPTVTQTIVPRERADHQYLATPSLLYVNTSGDAGSFAVHIDAAPSISGPGT